MPDDDSEAETKMKTSMAARARAFTLVETMLVVSIFGLIVALLAGITIDTGRLSGDINAQATLQSQTRLQLDVITQDIRSSDAVLASYTPSGGPTYTTDTGSTLVLQLPAVSADGSSTPATFTNATQTFTPNAFDVVIYYIAGTSAPYTLNRIVLPSAGSGRAAVANTAVVFNVQSATLGYQAVRTLTGNGTKTDFSIDAFSTPGQTVTVNGATLPQVTGSSSVPSGEARFTAPSTLTFGTAPAATDVVDASYPVSPASAASAVTSIAVALMVSSTNGGLRPTTTQTVALTSAANLSNH